MRMTLRYAVTMVSLALVALASGQEPLRAPTLQERVVQLEADVATIQTRFGLENTRPSNLGAGGSGLALEGRVTALERSLDRLAADLQRVERLADAATRAASQAQRDAAAAQQAARDALMRAR